MEKNIHIYILYIYILYILYMYIFFSIIVYIYIYKLYMNHFAEHQKLIQHCKSTIFQLKKKHNEISPHTCQNVYQQTEHK